MSVAIDTACEPFRPTFSRAQYVDQIREIHCKSVIEIGEKLIEARSALSYSEFVEMVERDLKDSFSPRTAFRYIAEAERAKLLSPVTVLSESYSTRAVLGQLAEDQLNEAIAAGTLRPGISRQDATKAVRAILGRPLHRPLSEHKSPSAPTLGAATTLSELVYLLIEARRAIGMPQVELDSVVGWGDTVASKYEILHDQRDGRAPSVSAIFDWLSALGFGLTLKRIGEPKRAEVAEHRVTHLRPVARAV